MRNTFKLIFGSLLLTSLITNQLFAEKLTKEQKKELYEKGTVTVYDDQGNKKGHFEVKLMPGSENIRENSKEKWKESAELMGQLLEKENFWEKKFLGSFNNGIQTIKDTHNNKGLGQVKEDWKKMKEKNEKVDGQFSSNIEKTKNVFSFGMKLIGRSISSLVGTGYGLAQSIVLPVGHVVLLPVVAGTKAVVAGTVWPALQYTWNGAAWVLVKESQQPQAGDLTVTYIPEDISENNENTDS